jgi:hypothetical protein
MVNPIHHQDFSAYTWPQDLIDLLRSEGQIIDTAPEPGNLPRAPESSRFSKSCKFSESSKFTESSESQEEIGKENGNHVSREREIIQIKIKVNDQELVHTILLILLLLYHLLSFI